MSKSFLVFCLMLNVVPVWAYSPSFLEARQHFRLSPVFLEKPIQAIHCYGVITMGRRTSVLLGEKLGDAKLIPLGKTLAKQAWILMRVERARLTLASGLKTRELVCAA